MIRRLLQQSTHHAGWYLSQFELDLILYRLMHKENSHLPLVSDASMEVKGAVVPRVEPALATRNGEGLETAHSILAARVEGSY